MASSISYAVNNLTELLTTVFTDASHTDWLIYLGTPQPRFTAPITLQIMGVTGDEIPAELGINYKREETYTIECMLVSFAGDQDFPSRMDEVFAAWAIVTAAIANDPSLTGVPNSSQNSAVSSGAGVGNSAVRFAQIKNHSFYGKADAAGKSIGCIEFDIHCEARIESLS